MWSQPVSTRCGSKADSSKIDSPASDFLRPVRRAMRNCPRPDENAGDGPESQEDYDAWVRNYGAPTPLTGRAEVAAQTPSGTFSVNCALCHTINPSDPETGKSRLDYDDSAVQNSRLKGFLGGLEEGQDVVPVPAPNLTDLRTRQSLGAGLLDLNVENIRRWLRNPEDVKPGNRMAQHALIYQGGDISLSDDEVEGLIEYLLQLQ